MTQGKGKVFLPDGTDVTENGLPDVDLQTTIKLYPLGTRFYPGDGRKFYYYKKEAAKEVKEGV